ncbi:hypothetical protein [Desulforhopalus sp. IMCC35007]|uniref:hypothetical protein n=1 Tax=Desulforhopalus sp. IMCC35007 TaxID=2569543 RepID=UPI00145FC1FC|nr:hypothetical protein [Desulforhopalus sp. IMCC35007]
MRRRTRRQERSRHGGPAALDDSFDGINSGINAGRTDDLVLRADYFGVAEVYRPEING